MTPEPGIYRAMTREVYDAIDAINWSSLKRIGESPELYRAKLDKPDPQDDKYIVGTMCGEFIEFPEQARAKYIKTPPSYPKLRKVGPCTITEDGEKALVASGRGDKREEWEVHMSMPGEGDWVKMEVTGPDGIEKLVESVATPWNGNATFCRRWVKDVTEQGRHVVSRSDLHDAKEMARRVRELPSAMKILDGGDCEVVVVWQDAHTGLWCKGMTDILKWPIFGEIKSMRQSIAYPIFATTAKRMGYFGQIAFYMDGLLAVLGRPADETIAPIARFLTVSNVYPYSAAYLDVFDMEGSPSQAFLLYGRALYLGYLREVKDCMENDHWPGPNREGPGDEPGGEFLVPEWLRLELPEWMMVG